MTKRQQPGREPHMAVGASTNDSDRSNDGTDRRLTPKMPPGASCPEQTGHVPMGKRKTYRQTSRNAWLQAVEQWMVGNTAPPGEQLQFPGMPMPPEQQLTRALIFQLAFYGNAAGADIRPTYARLARLNNCHPDTVKRAVKALLDVGLLSRHGPAYRGRAQSFSLQSPAWLHAVKGGTGAPLSYGTADHPDLSKGGAQDPRKGGTGAPPPFPLKGDGPYADSGAHSDARAVSAADNPPAEDGPERDPKPVSQLLDELGIRRTRRAS